MIIKDFKEYIDQLLSTYKFVCERVQFLWNCEYNDSSLNRPEWQHDLKKTILSYYLGVNEVNADQNSPP